MQRVNKQLSLEVGDIEMKFSASTPVATPLRVEWTPGTVPVKATHTAVSGYAGLQFLPTALLDVTDDDAATPQEGTANYLIKPESFPPSASDPFEERRSTLTLTAKDGTEAGANTISKTVTLRQFNPAIQIKNGNAVVTSPSIASQQFITYSLSVRSNDEWEMIVNNSNGVIARIDTPVGEPNITATGEVISLTMSDKSHNGESATLTFRHKNNPAIQQQITVIMRENEANSYIVPPVAGKNTVTIPISKVFRLWDTDQDLNGTRAGDASAMSSASGYTAEVLWQDEQNLITSVSPLSAQNNTGTFTVTVNNTGLQGNAVVVLKENGVIRWNWHIWVCDFNPEENTGYNSSNGLVVMDRDLGATSTIPGDISSYGMYYQWGRPAPFPKMAAVNSPTMKTIYGAAYVREDLNPKPDNLRNLANAIQNPTTYYYNTRDIPGVPTNWCWYSPITTVQSTVPQLWITVKTDFDPCPDGWQVPPKPFIENIPHPGVASGTYIILYNLEGDKLGLFPFSGGISPSTGSISTPISNYGSYDAPKFYVESITAAASRSSTSGNSAPGRTVRCTKIQ